VDELTVNLQTRFDQYAINDRRAELKEFGLDDRNQVEMAVPLPASASFGINAFRRLP
jgi:hypothetical protein